MQNNLKNLDLEVYHSTWAMERRHPDLPEWSLVEQCQKVAEAGFQGLNIDPGTEFIPKASVLKSTLDDFGLACSICEFPSSLDDLSRNLDYCLQVDATAIVVNARVFPEGVAEAADFVNSSIALGKQAGVPLQFETHRFTLTNDLLFTCQLVDACPELELVADLSHYVVGREMPMPVDRFHQELVTIILDRAVSIQGRIANREQIQVPIHFEQHQQWAAQFYNWWREGIERFVCRSQSGGTFNFTCELGPPDYAITDQNGCEMSDRWQESLVFKNKIEKIWNEVVRADD